MGQARRLALRKGCQKISNTSLLTSLPLPQVHRNPVFEFAPDVLDRIVRRRRAVVTLWISVTPCLIHYDYSLRPIDVANRILTK